jgi:thioredoxin reductase
MTRTVAIIGAGPIGLAAAHGCIARGHVPIVFEKATPGASLLRMGATRFFTPLSMNLPREVLALAGPDAVRRADALLTGPDLAHLLQSIAAAPLLAEHLCANHRVVSVTRHNLARCDHAGHPVRADLPFRVVTRSPEGERMTEADAVLDASGIYDTPVPIVAPGDEGPRASAIRDLGGLHARLEELVDRRILLVGHGHSAANAVALLEGLAERSAKTRVTWAVRSRNLRPIAAVPSDPLPERDRVVSLANRLAQRPPPWLIVERASFVESIEAQPDGAARVKLSGSRRADVDALVWLTGYRPDLAPLSELPLEISPASEGALRLQRALGDVTDCLSVPKVRPEDLASGEPRFHLVGAKSYGRARTFLLQTGYAHLETVLDTLFAT